MSDVARPSTPGAPAVGGGAVAGHNRANRKLHVLGLLETDLTNPGSLKSGGYLRKQIVTSARRVLESGDREGLVAALRDWLVERSEPKTMLAVDVIRELRLVELRVELEKLREKVVSGEAFKLFYIRWVDDALDAIK